MPDYITRHECNAKESSTEREIVEIHLQISELFNQLNKIKEDLNEREVDLMKISGEINVMLQKIGSLTTAFDNHTKTNTRLMTENTQAINCFKNKYSEKQGANKTWDMLWKVSVALAGLSISIGSLILGFYKL